MQNLPLILLVEDDTALAAALVASLHSAALRPIVAPTAAAALTEAQSRQPDLILLDLGLPDGDGLDLIPRLRAFSSVPILVLSARGHEPDRITALDRGADDFVPKPFSPGELHARIRAALRRARQSIAAGDTISFASIRVELAARSVYRDGLEVHLTPTEFKLLTVFLENRGRALTQRFLLNAVWGPQMLEQAQYLRVYVKQLRQKLEVDPSRPRFFRTEVGIGYRFTPDAPTG